MDNNSYINTKCKNKLWFENSYNKKLEELHKASKVGSILNYIDYNNFIKKFKNKINTKYFSLNINNISFFSFYGDTFKTSIFFKIIEDIDKNFNNKNYTYKDSLLYNELKQNKITTLSEYYNLNEPNNLMKYSKFYEFYPWNKNFKIDCIKLVGPLSDSIIEMHFIKFKRVLEGIKKYGIKYNHKNMISGFFLKKDNVSKFIVTSGIHRTIVIKYLTEINEIDVDIICEKTNKINLKNINDWYHVKNKFISKENAEKIFDFII